MQRVWYWIWKAPVIWTVPYQILNFSSLEPSMNWTVEFIIPLQWRIWPMIFSWQHSWYFTHSWSWRTHNVLLYKGGLHVLVFWYNKLYFDACTATPCKLFRRLITINLQYTCQAVLSSPSLHTCTTLRSSTLLVHITPTSAYCYRTCNNYYYQQCC